MNKPLQESTDNAIKFAEKNLQDLELDKALETVHQLLKNRPVNRDLGFTLRSNILWCEILLAKGRFSNDKPYPRLVLNKVLELQPQFHQFAPPLASIPFYLLLVNANIQLNKINEANQGLETVLEISQKEEYLIGQIQALNGLSKLALNEKKYIKALSLANQSTELLIQDTDEEHFFALAENYALLSAIYLAKSAFSQAKNYAERLLEICQRHDLKELEVKAHLLLGRNYIKQLENVLAITQLLEAKEKSQFIHHKYFLAQSILYIGIVYNHVFHYPKALENHNLVESLHYEFLDAPDQILLFNYLGKSHFLSFEDELAEEYFEKANILAKSKKETTAIAYSLAYMGRIYARKSKFKKSLIYAKKANEIIEKMGDIDGAQVNLINLGSVHNQLEKYNEGIKLASRGIAAAKRMKDGFYEIQGYQIMAEIFRKKKEYKSAVMYQMIYTKFYEDFYQRNDRQKVSETEHQFIIQKLEEEIKRLNQKK